MCVVSHLARLIIQNHSLLALDQLFVCPVYPPTRQAPHNPYVYLIRSKYVCALAANFVFPRPHRFSWPKTVKAQGISFTHTNQCSDINKATTYGRPKTTFDLVRDTNTTVLQTTKYVVLVHSNAQTIVSTTQRTLYIQ